MIEDEEYAAGAITPAANDNGEAQAGYRVNAAVLQIARLIGRQMAREEFERRHPANDNDSPRR
jgi:hypothetical protein